MAALNVSQLLMSPDWNPALNQREEVRRQSEHRIAPLLAVLGGLVLSDVAFTALLFEKLLNFLGYRICRLPAGIYGGQEWHSHSD